MAGKSRLRKAAQSVVLLQLDEEGLLADLSLSPGQTPKAAAKTVVLGKRAKKLQDRRLTAGRLLRKGKGVREVARLVKVSPSTVSRWKKALDAGGLRALKAKPPARSRLPCLSAKQKGELERVLLAGPQAAGFRRGRWTLVRVAQVIERLFGIKRDRSYARSVLRSMGWVYKKPKQRRGRRRDERVGGKWRKKG